MQQRSFQSIRDEIFNPQDYECINRESIVKAIAMLSDKETEKNKEVIRTIEKTLRSFGNIEFLNSKQHERLKKDINKTIDKKERFGIQTRNYGFIPSFKSYNDRWYDSGKPPKYDCGKFSNNRAGNGYPNSTPKLSTECEMFGVVAALLDNLNKNIMDSSITPIVLEFFELSTFFLEENPELYGNFMNEMKECFIMNGWKFPDETTSGGFHTSPNRKKIVEDVNVIIEKLWML